MKARLISFAALLTFGCNPPAPIADAPVDISLDTSTVDDVGTDASYAWDDAFAMDASAEDILCSGMPVPRDLPCEAQAPATASGCGGMGRVVYEQSIGCRVATSEACGSVRGAFNTIEECAMACGRLGRSPFPSRYQPVSGGEKGFRTGPLDFSPQCDAVMRQDADLPLGISRCAHFGFLTPLYEGRRAGVVPVPDTMSNQDVWELLNAVELVGFQWPYRGPLCVTPL